MRQLALLCAILALAACSNNTSQPPAPPQVGAATGSIAHPHVNDGSSVSSDAQATRMDQTGQYGTQK